MDIDKYIFIQKRFIFTSKINIPILIHRYICCRSMVSIKNWIIHKSWKEISRIGMSERLLDNQFLLEYLSIPDTTTFAATCCDIFRREYIFECGCDEFWYMWRSVKNPGYNLFRFYSSKQERTIILHYDITQCILSSSSANHSNWLTKIWSGLGFMQFTYQLDYSPLRPRLHSCPLQILQFELSCQEHDFSKRNLIDEEHVMAALFYSYNLKHNIG